MLQQKTKKSLMAFKESLNRRFDPVCQVKFKGIIGRNPKKSILFFWVGPLCMGERRDRCSPPASRPILDKLIRLCFMDVATSRRTHIVGYPGSLFLSKIKIPAPYKFKDVHA
jgi:hypothetical protein